jgi:hypothetical protein
LESPQYAYLLLELVVMVATHHVAAVAAVAAAK